MSSDKQGFKKTEIGLIPEDWELVTLDSIAEVIDPHPSHRAPKIIKNGQPYAGIKDFSDNGDISIEKCRKVSHDVIETQKNNLNLNYSEIGFGRVGTIGKIFFLRKQDFDYAISPTLAVIRSKRISSKLLYYLLKSKYTTVQLSKYSAGTTRPALGIMNLRNFLIPIPPLPEQKAIAKVLSDLDDKIELNNEMNKILEEIGQTLFKKWFIDFEFPNEKGNPYRSSGGEMICSKELGKEIPKGWEVGNIRKYIEFEKGIEPGSKSYLSVNSEENIRFIRVGDINNPGRDKTYIPITLSDGHFCNEDDILLSLDATIGIVRIGLKGVFSGGIRKVYSKSNVVLPKFYIYSLLKSEYIQNIIFTYANGTTILHAGSSLNYMNLAVPSERLLSKFSEITNPIFKNIIYNIIETKVLSELRDSLLPKLMSGEIRVPLEATQ